MKDWNLRHKKILVTGGAKGIGKATVLELASLEAEVLFTVRNTEELTALQNELRTQGLNVHGILCDVTSSDHRARVKKWIQEEWGTLDVLVNNAGINIRKPTHQVSKAELSEVMNTNLFAPYELCQELFSVLKAGNKPSVINVASVAGSFDAQTGAPYGISKAALIQLSRNLANEWAEHGIRVNSVSPWFTDTPLTSGLQANPEKLKKIISVTPLKRFALDHEIAATIAYLAMDKASYITGQNLSVDGGATSGILY